MHFLYITCEPWLFSILSTVLLVIIFLAEKIDGVLILLTSRWLRLCIQIIVYGLKFDFPLNRILIQSLEAFIGLIFKSGRFDLFLF